MILGYIHIIMPKRIDWDKVNRQKRVSKHGCEPDAPDVIQQHSKIQPSDFPLTREQQSWYERALWNYLRKRTH